jgi:4-hydroxy-2-oxoheptanedioate aldolase
VLNGWCSIGSPFGAELMAHIGWDSLTIDLQHGIVDYADMLGMLQGISTTPAIPLVRVPWNEPIMIQKALDAGAFGIICPMINSRIECENFVKAARYAPKGFRSVGPTRAVLYAGPDYHQNAEAAAITFAMIETKEALKNIDDIMSTPDLDAVYIGPTDLSLSLTGNPDSTSNAMPEAIRHVLERARHHGVRAGIHATASGDYAKQMCALGFDFVTVINDVRLISRYGRQLLDDVRSKS